MRTVEKARAKLNLGLDTPFRHGDGKIEWNMLMTSIDLGDYVEIETQEGEGISVNCNRVFLPLDQRNLAYQAALLLKEKYKMHQQVNIVIRKSIPVAAGMGGGSSDAAAVIRGLNRLWKLHMTEQEMATFGLQLDSDVPYCVYSKTAMVTGKGNQIDLMPKLPKMFFVIVKPSVSVSTPEILNKIDYDALTHVDMNALVKAVRTQDYDNIIEHMGNVLEPLSSSKHAEIKRIKNKFKKYGADIAQMSGTGPTVFGVCKTENQAKRVFNSMRGFCSEVYIVRAL
ncbi:4-(cytidine 5'-diphospho)-2-C-methyl-D-erythritol kinase [Apilactobacillus bombintestini]|uniref:4-diphosphocytidyl-2-C-methyl-D-erythritol kinase n=1 Tax=Apilactobacillus bombintestini TaxID=2419772 RepID=A0A387ASK5_9LACO|nr:4-(cytidine 5'-diphospho)-2-C-methyl-D-erythritol kinase [Apilactobacillus bombintestini]AYF92953.1 4-(cytidine 5'-diphospho)-2-C-methyl-D-erythritol kinase [Apilactobacillus bombintestini]